MAESATQLAKIEAEVREALADVYTPDGVEVWLNSRNTMLYRERPIDLLRTTSGASDVLRVANYLASGNF